MRGSVVVMVAHSANCIIQHRCETVMIKQTLWNNGARVGSSRQCMGRWLPDVGFGGCESGRLPPFFLHTAAALCRKLVCCATEQVKYSTGKRASNKKRASTSVGVSMSEAVRKLFTRPKVWGRFALDNYEDSCWHLCFSFKESITTANWAGDICR